MMSLSVDVKRARMLIVDQPSFGVNRMEAIFTPMQSAESPRRWPFLVECHSSRDVHR
jgi:hypothetical protein